MQLSTVNHLGGTIGAGSSKSGEGLESGVYEIVTHGEREGFAVMTDFTTAKVALCGSTAYDTIVSSTTANAIVVTRTLTGTRKTANVLVIGTPA